MNPMHSWAGALALAAAGLFVPSAGLADAYTLTIDPVSIDIDGKRKSGIGFNGASPGPVLRWKEGETVTIEVTNNLKVQSSIHWHGLILPPEMDGVPGISFHGIEPGETFTYTFPLVQSGTYWFHSHSGLQEADGAYGAIVIDPADREPFRYDREYVIQLTDKHPHAADTILRNLKQMPDYYNRQQQTLFDFFSDAGSKGVGATVSERRAWGSMRMMQTDVEDVQGFTALINGKSAAQNWTGVFEPGERIRLRLINSSAMTYFDVRIPGLQMTVVQADGNNVQPVPVDELRMAVAETYDVIVRPLEDRPYSLIAESMGRTGIAAGTLAPREGLRDEVPALRKAPLLTMADMGMAHEGMDHSQMAGMDHSSMQGMDHSQMAGMDHSSMSGMDHGTGKTADPFYAPGSGLMPAAAEGGKFLSYADLRAQNPLYPEREPTREIELRLTGNMERYSWSINGIKYEDAEPLRLTYGERVRFKFVNETMMIHPMHLHGMWSILDNGNGEWNPVKHVISIAPGTTVYSETEVDAPGQWAFHCHLAYHMASGMFRKVIVEGGPEPISLSLNGGAH